MNKQWLSLSVVVLLFPISVHSQDYNTGQLFEAVGSNDREAAKQPIPELILNIGHSAKVTKIALSPDGARLLSASEDNTVKLWDVQSGREIKSYSIGSLVHSISWSSDYKTFMAGNIQIDIETGTSVMSLDRHKRWISDFIFSPDGKKNLSLNDDYTIRLWDIKSGQCDTILQSNMDFPYFALFSSDGRYIFADWYGEKSMTWDRQDDKTYWYNKQLPYELNTVCFLPESKEIVFATSRYSDDVRLEIADIENGKILRKFNHPEISRDLIKELAYSFCFPVNKNKYILAGGKLKFYQDEQSRQNNGDVSEKVFITLLDEKTGNIIKEISVDPGTKGPGYFYSITDAKYIEKDNALYLLMKDDRLIRINTDNLEIEYIKNFSAVSKIQVTSNGDILILYQYYPYDYYFGNITIDRQKVSKELIIVNAENGEIINKLTGHLDVISSVSFSAGDRYLITSGLDNTIRFWDIQNGKEAAKLFLIGNTDWAVKTPEGLFDASPSAMKSMYYSVGTEIIELDQMKSRYYAPALLAKLMGYNEEPIRNISALDKLALYPDVKTDINNPENPVLSVDLTNRGGGIGKVVVTINGKEIAEDARGPANDPNAEKLNLNINIKNHPYLIPGKDNIIEVKAYNADGYLLSRGASVRYQPPVSENPLPPTLFILSCGVSDYTGEAIDLRYAAKDADNMTGALKIGGNRLFGTDRTLTWQMTSDQAENKLKPYKANILDVFNQISGKAQSQDVLTVYLSGHGINWGGQDGDFYYLTMDAYTGDIGAYNDPEIRKNCTLSSAELTELIKKIPALKQVLIIDACASGKTVENLMAKRDISSSTLRALDRMKDRIGLHIITGCAADCATETNFPDVCVPGRRTPG